MPSKRSVSMDPAGRCPVTCAARILVHCAERPHPAPTLASAPLSAGSREERIDMDRGVLAALLVSVSAFGGCSGERPSAWQGYVEGEYVHVASPYGGRLERLLVQRGETIEARTPLFRLESEEEAA